jgi:hypothetical protein
VEHHSKSAKHGNKNTHDNLEWNSNNQAVDKGGGKAQPESGIRLRRGNMGGRRNRRRGRAYGHRRGSNGGADLLTAGLAKSVAFLHSQTTA